MLDEPTTDAVNGKRPSIEMAFNAAHRQFTKVNAALTELQAASERRETTVRMLERINADWDELDAKLKVLAAVAVDCDRWTREPVERMYARLHKLLERGVVCGEQAAHGSSDLFLAQLRRLARRLLVNWDRNHARSGARASAEDLTGRNMAAALRAASGVGTTRSDLPRLDRDVRDAWLAEAPQPLAESIAELGDAHNAYQARDIAKSLILTLVRYLLAMALAMNARHREGRGDRGHPALLELMRAMNQRTLSIDSRIRLLRMLVHRLAVSPGAHPEPELLALLTAPPGGTDAMDRLLALYTATDLAITEEMVRLQLMRLLSELSQLLRQATFVLDYVLVVPHNRAPERWTGRRRQPRAPAYTSGGECIEGHPILLDREGRVWIDLWPLVQAVPPTDGAEPELFLFDGHGPHGAVLIAAPSGLQRQDAVAGDWVATHVIAALESRPRMRDQLRGAALRRWNRDRPDARRWRGKLLAVAVVIVLGVIALVLCR